MNGFIWLYTEVVNPNTFYNVFRPFLSGFVHHVVTKYCCSRYSFIHSFIHCTWNWRKLQ